MAVSSHTAGSVLAIFAVLGTLPALAADNDPLARGIDPMVFKPATTANRFLTLEGATLAKKGTMHAHVIADYAAGLMALKLGDDKLGNLLGHRVDLHLVGGYALLERLTLAADLPVVAYQQSNFDLIAEETGFRDDEPASAALGDPRLLGQLLLVDQQTAFVDIGFVGEVRIPVGNDQAFAGERGFVAAPRLVVERTLFDRLRLAVEGGFRYRSSAGQYLNLHVGNELHAGVAAAYGLPDVGPFAKVTALGEMQMATPARAPLNTGDSAALKTPAELLFGVRGELPSGLEMTVAAGRGIGIESGLGKHAARVMVTLTWRREPGDRDHDGVPDLEDQCPDIPGPQQLDGCPDRDGDEIPDVEDECPDDPGPASNDGCPVDPPLAELESEEISLRGQIQFAFDKAIIKEKSKPIIQKVAEIMRANPEITKVRVEGHTDSQGPDAYNLNLSQRRANAVVDYLVELGIARDRLIAKGFGETKPIAFNRTALGRAKNRRVEFLIVERQEIPEPDIVGDTGEPEGETAPEDGGQQKPDLADEPEEKPDSEVEPAVDSSEQPDETSDDD